MTYSGVVLLLTGWQADEDRVVKQYHELLESYVRFLRDPYALTYAHSCAHLCVASVESKYPYGSLWLLNRVGSIQPPQTHCSVVPCG
jgi:hypothetical protein